MLLNCGIGEDSWESLDSKEIKPVNPKGNQPWILIGRTDAKAETPILWPPDVKSWLIGKDSERLKAGRKGADRGWDGWMASPTQWTWIWANSRRWWRKVKPGVLQSMGLQRVRHNWQTEQQNAYLLENTLFILRHFNHSSLLSFYTHTLDNFKFKSFLVMTIISPTSTSSRS